MSQTIALIVHAIMDAPDHWEDSGSGHITNGYYKVGLDSSFYSMGEARYNSSSAERDIFARALTLWKETTGWKPKERVEKKTTEETPRISVTPDTYIRSGYEEFSRAVRSNLKSFVVHGDSHILSNGLQKAIDALDGVLRPMEKI